MTAYDLQRVPTLKNHHVAQAMTLVSQWHAPPGVPTYPIGMYTHLNAIPSPLEEKRDGLDLNLNLVIIQSIVHSFAHEFDLEITAYEYSLGLTFITAIYHIMNDLSVSLPH